MATTACYKYKGGCTYYWERMNQLHSSYQRQMFFKDEAKAAARLQALREAFKDYKDAGGKKEWPYKEITK